LLYTLQLETPTRNTHSSFWRQVFLVSRFVRLITTKLTTAKRYYTPDSTKY